MDKFKVECKKILVWEDKNKLKCVKLSINTKLFKTTDSLLEHVTEKLDTNKAIISLINLDTKEVLELIEDLEDGGKYVAVENRDGTFHENVIYETESEHKFKQEKKKEYALYQQGDSDYKDHDFLNFTKKYMKTIIFVLINGRERQAGKKFVFTREDLEGKWQIILNYIAHFLNIVGGLEGLYTLCGDKICGSWELQHGSAYVAVKYHEKFKKMDYLEVYKNFFPKKSSYIVDIKAVSGPSTFVVKRGRSILCFNKFRKSLSVKCRDKSNMTSKESGKKGKSGKSSDKKRRNMEKVTSVEKSKKQFTKEKGDASSQNEKNQDHNKTKSKNTKVDKKSSVDKNSVANKKISDYKNDKIENAKKNSVCDETEEEQNKKEPKKVNSDTKNQKTNAVKSKQTIENAEQRKISTICSIESDCPDLQVKPTKIETKKPKLKPKEGSVTKRKPSKTLSNDIPAKPEKKTLKKPLKNAKKAKKSIDKTQETENMSLNQSIDCGCNTEDSPIKTRNRSVDKTSETDQKHYSYCSTEDRDFEKIINVKKITSKDTYCQSTADEGSQAELSTNNIGVVTEKDQCEKNETIEKNENSNTSNRNSDVSDSESLQNFKSCKCKCKCSYSKKPSKKHKTSKSPAPSISNKNQNTMDNNLNDDDQQLRKCGCPKPLNFYEEIKTSQVRDVSKSKTTSKKQKHTDKKVPRKLSVDKKNSRGDVPSNIKEDKKPVQKKKSQKENDSKPTEKSGSKKDIKIPKKSSKVMQNITRRSKSNVEDIRKSSARKSSKSKSADPSSKSCKCIEVFSNKTGDFNETSSEEIMTFTKGTKASFNTSESDQSALNCDKIKSLYCKRLSVFSDSSSEVDCTPLKDEKCSKNCKKFLAPSSFANFECKGKFSKNNPWK